jgi:3-keto-disaccharide hydrolase
MRSIVVLFVALCVACVCFAETINFDKAAPGAMPPGWTVAMTHKGGSPKWEIIKDDSAPSKPNVLAQVSTDATGGRFPLAVYDQASLTDGTLSVKFKAISGNTDQAAGLVWRYQDPDNYYIVRANALEDNIVLYKVEKRQRIALAPKGTPSKTYGVKHRVPKQTWSTLSVTFRGNLFTVSFDGQKVFDVEDSTFTAAGKVGLWTKADSVTYFDDFNILEIPSRQ